MVDTSFSPTAWLGLKQFPWWFQLCRLCGAAQLPTYSLTWTFDDTALYVTAGRIGALFRLLGAGTLAVLFDRAVLHSTSPLFVQIALLLCAIFLTLYALGALKILIFSASYEFDLATRRVRYDGAEIATLDDLQSVFVTRQRNSNRDGVFEIGYRLYLYTVALNFRAPARLTLFRSTSEDRSGELANAIVNGLNLPFDYEDEDSALIS